MYLFVGLFIKIVAGSCRLVQKCIDLCFLIYVLLHFFPLVSILSQGCNFPLHHSVTEAHLESPFLVMQATLNNHINKKI